MANKLDAKLQKRVDAISATLPKLKDFRAANEEQRKAMLKENPFPYAFWDIRDLREVIKAAALATGINVKYTVKLNGTAHKALDDADVQARQLVEGENLLVESRKAFLKMQDATTSEDDAVNLINELAKIHGLDVTIAAQMGVQNG